MNNSAIIKGSDGKFWLQVQDSDGRLRISYLGNLGRAYMVKGWCELRGIDYVERIGNLSTLRPEIVTVATLAVR
jgi:hypothetical protein